MAIPARWILVVAVPLLFGCAGAAAEPGGPVPSGAAVEIRFPRPEPAPVTHRAYASKSHPRT